MGLPQFRGRFKREYKGAFVHTHTVRADFLYIDANQLVHDAFSQADDLEGIYECLFSGLDAILLGMRPKHFVMIALDGPGPITKFSAQQASRKEMAREEEAETTVVPRYVITPGMPFMQEIAKGVEYYVCSRLGAKDFQHLTIEVSGPTVMGEGEMKILSRIKNNIRSTGVSPHDWKAGHHVIVSGDSDLIISALFLDLDHIYVLESINETKIFSIPAFNMVARQWQDGTKSKGSSSVPRDVLRQLKADFAICKLLEHGNDYLCSLGCMDLWKTYSESNAVKSKYKGLVVVGNGSTFHLNLKTLGTLISKASCPGGSSKQDGSNSKKPKKFVTDLQWVLHMYISGSCPDYRFECSHVGVERNSLVSHLRGTKKPCPPVPHSSKKPLNPVACALAVLPPESRQYFSPAFQHLIDEGPSEDSGVGSMVASHNNTGSPSTSTELAFGAKPYRGKRKPTSQLSSQNGVSLSIGSLSAEVQEIKKKIAHCEKQLKVHTARYDSCRSSHALIQSGIEDYYDISCGITDGRMDALHQTKRSLVSALKARERNVPKNPRAKADKKGARSKRKKSSKVVTCPGVYPSIKSIEDAVKSIITHRLSPADSELMEFGCAFLYKHPRQLHAQLPEYKSMTHMDVTPPVQGWPMGKSAEIRRWSVQDGMPT